MAWRQSAAAAAKCSMDDSPWVHIVMSTITTAESIPEVIPHWIVENILDKRAFSDLLPVHHDGQLMIENFGVMPFLQQFEQLRRN